jgi:hypothetical protein
MFRDGTTTTSGYIVRQVGDTAYIVQDTAQLHAAEICFVSNNTSVAALNPGFCFIVATPFGGSALPCAKIQQHRLETFEANGTRGSYTWNTLPAFQVGQADLIVPAVVVVAPVNTSAPVVSGTTTAGSTLTTTNGTWTGSPTFSYQWTINGVNDGTNAPTYVIPAGAAGRTVVCNVTGTNAGGSSTASSNTITTT